MKEKNNELVRRQDIIDGILSLDCCEVRPSALDTILNTINSIRPAHENEWISVKDRLPNKVETLLFSVFGRPQYGYYLGNNGTYEAWVSLSNYFREAYYPSEFVTHWMPLPFPPSEK